MRKTFTETMTKGHPHEEEEKLLKGWAVTPLKAFRDRHVFLLNYLKLRYPKEQLDLDFYAERFKEFLAIIEPSKVEKDRFELVFTDLLSQWDALLQGKILAYQLNHLEDARNNFTELLEAKVSEYDKLQSLINPFTDYMGWDMSRDLWQNTSFNVLEQYDQLLRDEASIQRLADLLGDLREAEIEMEEETFEKTIVRQEWKVDELAKAEIVGVHESRDLSNLLSSEVSLLSDATMESLFLKKYVDQQLLTFRYEDRRLVPSRDQVTEVNQRVRLKEKGPFIVCVDTSESMTGRPEEIAKVLCLAILKMASRDNRRAFLINFSVGIKTIDLYDIANSLDAIAKFLSMSFYGGTDASLALFEALRQLKSHDYEDADVLMISDFIMYKFNEDLIGEIRYFQQNKGTEFHSLALSSEANSNLLQLFDTNWIYDPKQKGIIK
ncbi:MAG: VWA domain-containing protein, partial [Bacteroidota bacterium]